MCTKRSQRGLTLVELIMFIVIVSIALTGILLVTNQTSAHSADTLLRKQALAAAESLLEEIEARPFAGACNSSSRPIFVCVGDYNNYGTSGVYDTSGSAVPGLSEFGVSVNIANIAAASFVGVPASQITVTVTMPTGKPVAVTGIRTNY